MNWKLSDSLVGMKLFSEVSVQRADGRSDLFSSQTLGELKFLPVTDAVFQGFSELAGG